MEQFKKFGLSLYLASVGTYLGVFFKVLVQSYDIWGSQVENGETVWFKIVYVSEQVICTMVLYTVLLGTVFILREIKGFSFKKVILYGIASAFVAYGSVYATNAWVLEILERERLPSMAEQLWAFQVSVLMNYMYRTTSFIIILCICTIIQAIQKQKQLDHGNK